MTRQIKFVDALREAQEQLLETDSRVYLLGLCAPGPTGIFASVSGLADKFGPDRVIDMPSSENGMTGIALGTSIVGMRPIMIHMRMDFAVLSMEPLVNQAAKWHYMYGGQMTAPLTIRMIVGRGWGQGPQHSQSLQAWFAHVPGLRVVMPTTPYDAKGMLIAAAEDDAPVIFVEHRWLYGISGDVPKEMYRVSLDTARVARPGRDITFAATSYMTLEALRAADLLAQIGIDAEVVDLRSLTPIDGATLEASVRKTGRLIATDTGHDSFGVSAEVLAVAVERAGDALSARPRRCSLPWIPTPTSPALAEHYYPRAGDLAQAALDCLGSNRTLPAEPSTSSWHDVPDPTFTGPY